MYSFYLEKLVIDSAIKYNTNSNKTSSERTEADQRSPAFQQQEKQASLSKIVEEFTAKGHLLCPSGGQTWFL